MIFDEFFGDGAVQGAKNKQKFKAEVKLMREQISMLMAQLQEADRKSVSAPWLGSAPVTEPRANLNDSGNSGGWNEA